MSDSKKINKLSVLLMASILTANIVCANDTYKNNVVDVRVNKETGNAVKVTIYTDKPYTEPVVVNKKANNKYVILMPETSSSLKGTPSITGVSGTVSNVSVNTQAVSGGKGYTKIVITSDKAITVVPRTQQMSSAKPVEQKPVTVTKPVQTKTVTAQNANAQQLAQQKAKQDAEKKAKAEKLRQENLKKQQLAQQKAKQDAQRLAQQKAQEELAKKQAQQKAQQQKIADNKEPLEILENEIKTGNDANINDHKEDEVLNQEIKENSVNKKQQVVEQDNQSVIESIKLVLKNFQQIGLWKLLLLAGAITLPVIVIMFILTLDKRINKKIEKSFKKEDDIQEIQTPVEQESQPQAYNSFDEVLSQTEEPIPSYNEELSHQTEYEQYQQSVNDLPINMSEHETENDFVDADFENDINTDLVNTVEDVQQVQQSEYIEPEYIEPEPEIPEIIEPEITEEVQEFEPIAEEPPAPLQPYNPDGYLSDFSEVNDQEFFDELVMQSLADGNSNGLPEESPADAIFDFMNNDKSEQEQVSDFDNEQTVFQPVENVNVESENNQVATEETDEDNLTMLTEVKISDTKGLYLVNYDNFSSLVGHINDDYFVIKKFDDIVNSRIILKETEKLKDATRYLVRVGRNKMVLEVSETSMSRLLDL